MTEIKLDSNYWNNRFENADTPWDIGAPSAPLKEYIDQLKDNTLKILIPGAGNSHEAEYLYKQGFKNVFVVDISEKAIANFKNRFPGFPSEQAIHEDFFEHTGKYDLILEQTFFCALDPSLRTKYVKKMHELLNPGGKLAGLLFNDKLNTDQPPFGGFKEEYEVLFAPYFHFKILEPAYNSIPPRAGRELFIIMVRR